MQGLSKSIIVAAVAANMSLVKQMQGNNDPAFRATLIRQQMQGGK